MLKGAANGLELMSIHSRLRCIARPGSEAADHLQSLQMKWVRFMPVYTGGPVSSPSVHSRGNRSAGSTQVKAQHTVCWCGVEAAAQPSCQRRTLAAAQWGKHHAVRSATSTPHVMKGLHVAGYMPDSRASHAADACP